MKIIAAGTFFFHSSFLKKSYDFLTCSFLDLLRSELQVGSCVFPFFLTSSKKWSDEQHKQMKSHIVHVIEKLF